MVVTVENVDEITQCKFEGVVKVLRSNSRKEVDKTSYLSDVDIQVMCQNEGGIILLMLLKSSIMMLQLMRKLKHVLTHLMCSSSNDDIEKNVLFKLDDVRENEDATAADLLLYGELGSIPLVIKDAKPLVLASRGTFIASTSRSSALLTLFNATQFRVPKGDVMPAEIRAQVDVAKEIPGGTLKFTTRKKRLEDSAGGISSYRCCLKLRSCLAILVIRVEKNVGEVYAMI